MAVDFTDRDILNIYGFFSKRIAELEKMKAAPECPFSSEDIDFDLQRFKAITEKIEAAYPGAMELKPHFPRVWG